MKLTQTREGLAGFILRQPATVLAFGISIALGLGYMVWYSAYGLGSDFSVYWRAANLPASSVYSDIPKLSFPYAPTMLLWVAPLKIVPEKFAYSLWIIGSLAAFVWACTHHLKPAETTLAAISPAAVLCAATGQVTLALTAAILLSCALRNRLPAGVILGCVASVKPQIVALAPLFLLVRADWRAFIGAAISFSAIMVLSMTIFGISLWQAWFLALPELQAFFLEVGVVMVTPMSVASRYGLPVLPAFVLGALLASLIVWRARGYGPVPLMAAIACSSLLVSPYAVVYDLVVLSPFLAWAAFRGSYSAALGLSALAHPLPLLAGGWNLMRRYLSHNSKESPAAFTSAGRSRDIAQSQP